MTDDALRRALRPSVSLFGASEAETADDLRAMVVLDGGLGYTPTNDARTVADQLDDRAEHVGALVAHRPTANYIFVSPWSSRAFYRLHYRDVGEPVERITAHDKRTDDDLAEWAVADLLKQRRALTSNLDGVPATEGDWRAE